MSFTADFTRLTKYREDSSANLVRFAAGAPALETEFNEIQMIADKRSRETMTMFGNGLLGEGSISYADGTFSMDGDRAIVNGIMIYISHLELDVQAGDSIYLDVFEKEITYKDVMRKYGNEQEVFIPNYILDERFGKEISKRVVIAYNLSKADDTDGHYYLKLAQVDENGVCVADPNCVIKTFEANDILITIPADGWKKDVAVSMYNYYKDIPVDICDSSMTPSLTILPESMRSAIGCGMCASCQTLEGELRVWAYQPPDVSIKASLYLSGYTSGYRAVRSRSGQYLSVLPVASDTQIGGVRVRNGSGLKVDANGNLILDTATEFDVIDSLKSGNG